jgi:hypothetical protein
VAVLFTAGDQVPEILLLEIMGNVKVAPAHIGTPADGFVNVGVMFPEFTVTVIVAVVPHCPALGVNV